MILLSFTAGGPIHDVDTGRQRSLNLIIRDGRVLLVLRGAVHTDRRAALDITESAGAIADALTAASHDQAARLLSTMKTEGTDR